MFINVTAEAVTAITITLLLSSDEFCFILIFEQSGFVVTKVAFVSPVFIGSIFDVFGACVVDTNLCIGS